MAIDPAEASDPGDEPAVRLGRARRAPRYGSFVFSGIVVGVVLGLLLSITRPSTGQFSQDTVIGYVAAIFGLLGALAGAAFAIFFDRRSSQRSSGK